VGPSQSKKVGKPRLRIEIMLENSDVCPSGQIKRAADGACGGQCSSKSHAAQTRPLSCCRSRLPPRYPTTIPTPNPKHLTHLIAAAAAGNPAEDPARKAQMDAQMKALQQFLMEAEAGGHADKPMMIKEVDGRMVMEAVPEEMMKNFVFPDSAMEKDDI